MIGVGVVGYGYWGPNLVRNFFEVPGCRVAAVSDLRRDRLAQVEGRHPSVRTTADHRDLLADPAIDAVAIATPVSSHYRLAREALEAGKHVLVEKPLASTSREAEELVLLARSRGRILMVDHTFVYTGAVRKIREIVERGLLGEVYYYDSVRVNLGLFQHDVNVLWDLAVHDLSILDHVLPSRPRAVSATGMSHVPGGPENLAYLTLFFDGAIMAHVHVNWLAPVKLRRTLLGGSRKMIVYDDLEPSEKVKVYDRGIKVNGNGNGHGHGHGNGNGSASEALHRTLIDYRVGDMWAPQIDITEALKVEAGAFVRSIETGEAPPSDGEAGLRVVRTLEAATRSLAERGRPIEIEQRAEACAA